MQSFKVVTMRSIIPYDGFRMRGKARKNLAACCDPALPNLPPHIIGGTEQLVAQTALETVVLTGHVGSIPTPSA